MSAPTRRPRAPRPISDGGCQIPNVNDVAVDHSELLADELALLRGENRRLRELLNDPDWLSQRAVRLLAGMGGPVDLGRIVPFQEREQ